MMRDHQTIRSRNGKIARLPENIREELNQRLERCERSPQLLAWLNALPIVQEFVRREFGGERVSKHNLSQWRLGGFQDWLTRRDFFSDAQNADDFMAERQQEDGKVMADHAATVLAARYASMLVRWDGKCTREFQFRARALNQMSRGVVDLQREAHKANLDNFTLTTLKSGVKCAELPIASQSVAPSRSEDVVKPVKPMPPKTPEPA